MSLQSYTFGCQFHVKFQRTSFILCVYYHVYFDICQACFFKKKLKYFAKKSPLRDGRKLGPSAEKFTDDFEDACGYSATSSASGDNPKERDTQALQFELYVVYSAVLYNAFRIYVIFDALEARVYVCRLSKKSDNFFAAFSAFLPLRVETSADVLQIRPQPRHE